MAAFGAAAVSTSLGACGARGGLEIGVSPPRSAIDAGVDSGSFIGAYGTPSFADAAFLGDGGLGDDTGATHAEYGGPPMEEDAGVDSGLCEDPGCTNADYGGPPGP